MGIKTDFERLRDKVFRSFACCRKEVGKGCEECPYEPSTCFEEVQTDMIELLYAFDTECMRLRQEACRALDRSTTSL